MFSLTCVHDAEMNLIASDEQRLVPAAEAQDLFASVLDDLGDSLAEDQVSNETLQMLVDAFPEAYPAYMQRTGRLLPRRPR